jgi:hypothetical protein
MRLRIFDKSRAPCRNVPVRPQSASIAYREWARHLWLLLPIIVGLSGCADLTAVSTFSKSAPDVAKLDELTDVYVEDPRVQANWSSLSQPPDPADIQLVEDRKNQKVAFDHLHGLIVDYMKALGDASGAKLNDLSAKSKDVSKELSDLQKKNLISATAAQVTAIGDFVEIAPKNFLNLYRARQIAKIMKDCQKSFDAAIDVEIGIVSDVYILDYKITSHTITSQRDFVEKFASTPKATGLTSVVKFLFEREVQLDVTKLDQAQTAATQYVAALKKLKSAYDALVDKDGKFDDKTLMEIKPYLSAAAKAYTDVNAT